MTRKKPFGPEPLAPVVHSNIQAMLELRSQREAEKSIQDRIADRVTRFTGSMSFVGLHAALFGGWIAVNSGWLPIVRPFDPFPFVMLAMLASVEAIFLSTFVLISQNRMAQLNERRAELDLQINLLSEHELTRTIELLDEIASRLGVEDRDKPDLEPLKRDVSPEAVIREIERSESCTSGDPLWRKKKTGTQKD